MCLLMQGASAKLGEKDRIGAGVGEGFPSEIVVSHQKGADPGKVDDRERDLIVCSVDLTALLERIADSGTKCCTVHGRIFGKSAQPAGIVPAVSRLGLFAGNHVGSHVGEHGGCVNGGHEAGVKAHEVEGRIFL